MLPVIKHPASIKRVLNYNEKKVQQKKAELIYAGNFIKNTDELTFREKLERFEKQMALNQRAETKVMHVSINYHPNDAAKLTRDMQIELAKAYMEKIGFGNQPYLVYEHTDSGHPHVHVVTTLIREDGSRINTHNLGRDVSEPARKKLEEQYGLIKADRQGPQQQKEQHLKIDAQKVEYGQAETKRSVINVLDNVIDNYAYTTLPELNAILKQYNVEADRGGLEGRIYKNRGLIYHVLDDEGTRIGVPIKASSIYSKPTLDKIEGKFQENKIKKTQYQQHLITTIDWVLHKEPKSLEEFIKALEKERIAVVVRISDNGRVYGITYVDNEKQTVFNGSDLGKKYSANKILQKLGQLPEKPIQLEVIFEREKIDWKSYKQNIPDKTEHLSKNNLVKELSNIAKDLLESEQRGNMNNELSEHQKRKRRQQQQQRD